jgi:Family of unknown function (DUF6247)
VVSAFAAFHSAEPFPASTPREIRAAPAGEETGHFDREYRQAMADAAESLPTLPWDQVKTTSSVSYGPAARAGMPVTS